MKSVKIVQLYPKEMNVYGDKGNILAIKKRLEWRGISAEIIDYNVGDSFPENVDIIIGGGGQDSGQSKIKKDLQKISGKLKNLAENGTPMLMICGMYQLFGNEFLTISGEKIKGIGILDVSTSGGDVRMIGNIITKSEDFGELVGYENHSGKTFLGKNAEPFAKALLGAGNNNEDGFEGARYKNVIGTYLHGPILPKNPKLADFLIETALKNRKEDFVLQELDDELENSAHKTTKTRPR